MKSYYVYIISNKKYGVLYIGVTSNLVKRIYQHKVKSVDGFSKKYNLNKLVYYEIYNDVNEAILREKRMKKWKRSWKVALINDKNEEWKDLYGDII